MRICALVGVGTEKLIDGFLGTTFSVLGDGRCLIFATCQHVVQNHSDLRILIPFQHGNVGDTQPYPLNTFTDLGPASIVASDPLADLCLLKIENSTLVPKVLMNSLPVNISQEILVTGYPFCVGGTTLQTLNHGRVSALTRRTISKSVSVHEFLVDVPAHPGASGSPVVSKVDGRLVGVVRASLGSTSPIQYGNIPIGSDSTMTAVVEATHLNSLLSDQL